MRYYYYPGVTIIVVNSVNIPANFCTFFLSFSCSSEIKIMLVITTNDHKGSK